jgi:hypothetical protein
MVLSQTWITHGSVLYGGIYSGKSLCILGFIVLESTNYMKGKFILVNYLAYFHKIIVITHYFRYTF